MKTYQFILILIVILASLLRLFHLGNNPPSLNWDEASLGYNAYSILKSGTDEFGENFPLARFIAFGDYKPPGYIYADVPSIALFGAKEFAVRFPSAFAGILMTVLTYFLALELFNSTKIALLSSLFIGISPWSIHLSRGAFEANLASLFNMAGIYFFIKSLKKGKNIIISMLFFLVSFYTFNANRIIAPLMFFALSIIYFKNQIKNLKWNALSLIIAVILFIPSITFLVSSESKLRFQEVSIFNNLQPVILSNQRISQDGNAFFSKIIHNRRVLFTTDYLKHLTDNFSLRFLFTHGDVNPRLSVQGMGQLYFFDLPFVLMGIIYLIYVRKNITVLLFSWMLISVVPAGTARETPHALRIVSILPSFQIIGAVGLYYFMALMKSYLSSKLKLLTVLALSVLLFCNIFYYLHLYHIHFPRDWSGEFQYGTKEMVNFVLNSENDYSQIFVSPAIGRPYIFFAFYKPFAPLEFQSGRKASRDGFGFWNVNSLGKIYFNLNSINSFTGKSLFVSTEKNLPENFHLLKIIYDLSPNPVFYISEKI